jgi:hypothetical protein
MKLIDKEDDVAACFLHFLERRLEALLKLLDTWPRDHGRQVELHHSFAFERLGHVLRTMRCASPSTIAVLPTPGSPINTGLFWYDAITPG